MGLQEKTPLDWESHLVGVPTLVERARSPQWGHSGLQKKDSIGGVFTVGVPRFELGIPRTGTTFRKFEL